MTSVRDPRQDASRVLPDGYEARVLEPSLPVNSDPDWFADDPTAPEDATDMVVSPTGDADTTWAELARSDGAVARYAHDHWLDGRRRLGPLPEAYEATRRALHQVAFFVVAPVRHGATGKLGLRFTHRGFGTPFFGEDEQVRVESGVLVRQVGGEVFTHRIRTIEDAASFLGIAYREVWFEAFHDPLPPVEPTADLTVDHDAAEAIGEWFGFATHVLERGRRTPGATDVSRVQLWPEHFDSAFEMGPHEAGARASYGASPGDDAHPEPYLYVAPWGDIDRSDPYWNDPWFSGASLGYRELLGAHDPYAIALDFFHQGHARLTA